MMNRERYDWLWQRDSREAVVAALAKLEDGPEREAFYVRAVEVTQRWRPSLARFLSEAYVDEFYMKTEPFGPGVAPNGEVLRVLARTYEQEGALEMAEWVCEIALSNEITADGLGEGFAGWLERIQQKRAVFAGRG
ncbi:MAG: hypothetical protein PHC88_08410 [Terrimicrobiaceae bacterium]|nr:hypothetical protein [Terrimicrobiaceae bacterium]